MNFAGMPPSPPVFDNADAAFMAAGVDMSPNDEVQEKDPLQPQTGQAMSTTDMIIRDYLEQLMELNTNSHAYQDTQRQQNKDQMKEADALRRKLGK